MFCGKAFVGAFFLLTVFYAVAEAGCNCPECFSTVLGGCNNRANWRPDRLSCPGKCGMGSLTCTGWSGNLVHGKQYYYEYLSCYNQTSSWVQSQINNTGITINNCVQIGSGNGSYSDSESCDGTKERSSVAFTIGLIAFVAAYVNFY